MVNLISWIGPMVDLISWIGPMADLISWNMYVLAPNAIKPHTS